MEIFTSQLYIVYNKYSIIGLFLILSLFFWKKSVTDENADSTIFNKYIVGNLTFYYYTSQNLIDFYFNRLDFDQFMIGGPEIVNHVCNNDQFIVSGGSPVPAICGTNTGNHSEYKQ